MYCRLIDKGMNKQLSMSVCKYYGILIYSWLGPCTVVAVRLSRP